MQEIPVNVEPGDVSYNENISNDTIEADADEAVPIAENLIIYIADMTAELASMARRAKLDIAAYLLDMSHVETLSALDGCKEEQPKAPLQIKESLPPGRRSKRPARSSSSTTR
jgi:hypothetical protein